MAGWGAIGNAATSVSGPIVTDTTWFANQGPYTVTSDVFVQAGATLLIEPGVTVYMNTGANLIIENGALKASGTASQPILITSSAASPVAGDWGQLRFLNGTNSLLTILEHTFVKFGQGIVVQSASPTFNYLAIENNSGPAVSIDLASSPVGTGNSASGNAINGVAVPSGEILGNISWNLQGLPYVVASGVVSVGQAPAITGIATSDIQQGATLNTTISGTRLSGAEQIIFDNPEVTATILSGGGASSIPVSITAAASVPLGGVPFEVQVAAGKARSISGINVISPKPVISVSGLAPSSLRRGESKQIQATGANLAGATVTTNGSGLTISSVQTTANQATFTLAASASAVLGTQQINFNNDPTTTGTATASVTVLKALPNITINPALLAVPPDSASHQFRIGLSEADDVDHTFTIGVSNTAIATVTPATFVIPAGQTQALVGLTGLSNGQTSITVSSAGLTSVTVPIYVTPEFSGLNTSYSSIVGVVKQVQPSAAPEATVSGLMSASLGVVKGNHIQSISPKALIVGSGPIPLVISGVGLDAATSVTVSPATGLTLGSFSASADGKTLTVPVTIDPNAATTIRQVIVSAGATPYPAVSPDADRIHVVMPQPVVDSIDPLFAVPGTNNLSLTIRGKNFGDLFDIEVNPPTGVTVGSPAFVNGSATQISVPLAIASNAPTGPRVVTVTTLAGTSDATPSSANTFSVVSQIQGTVTPIAAPLLGVVKQQAAQSTSQSYGLASSALGVVVGPVATGVSPVAGSIGNSFTLTIQGSNLVGLTAVDFSPNTGLTVGTPSVAADGTAATVTVSIAADAPQTLRTVQLLAGTAKIPFATPAAALFRVTSPQPQVASVSPLYLQLGAAPTVLTVRGMNFQNAQQVKIVPSTDMTVSLPPVVNTDGTELTVNISAAANAVAGQRVVVVVTPAGETSSTATIGNAINLVSDLGTTYSPLAAPLLGVVKQVATTSSSTLVGPIVSANVGVFLQQDVIPILMPVSPYSPQLGVVKGAYASAVQAVDPLIPGVATTLMVTGQNLNGVTGVTLTPATGLTIGSPMQVSVDGSQVSVPVTVDATAAIGVHALTLTSAGGNIPFVKPVQANFYVAAGVPTILSISPILGTQGAGINLTINGTNLQNANVVTLTPSHGITLASKPVVNATGDQLTVPFAIDPSAPLGARVVQVITPGGATPAAGDASNTFTVYAP